MQATVSFNLEEFEMNSYANLVRINVVWLMFGSLDSAFAVMGLGLGFNDFFCSLTGENEY
jgi:hypothetical protein